MVGSKVDQQRTKAAAGQGWGGMLKRPLFTAFLFTALFTALFTM
jgi:hypothetical protein